MIVIKHGYKPEPKRWKFKCGCGCEWIADETEISSINNYYDTCSHNLIFCHAISNCPECGHDVEDERTVDADEYENILMQTDPSGRISYDSYEDLNQTEEEKPF